MPYKPGRNSVTVSWSLPSAFSGTAGSRFTGSDEDRPVVFRVFAMSLALIAASDQSLPNQSRVGKLDQVPTSTWSPTRPALEVQQFGEIRAMDRLRDVCDRSGVKAFLPYSRQVEPCHDDNARGDVALKES